MAPTIEPSLKLYKEVLGSGFKVLLYVIHYFLFIVAASYYHYLNFLGYDGAKSYSNTALKKGDIYNEAIKSGAKGLPFLKVMDDGKHIVFGGGGSLEGISALVSSLDPTNKEQLLSRCSAGLGDLMLFAVGQQASVNITLDRLRVFVAHELSLVDHSRHSILWVTNFPMFEWNDSEQRLEWLPCEMKSSANLQRFINRQKGSNAAILKGICDDFERWKRPDFL